MSRPARNLALGVAAALASLGAAAERDSGDARWVRVAAPAGIDRAEAVAIDPGSGRLAIGGERGVALGPLHGPLERVLARGPVRDLGHLGDGSLLVATDVGLYRIEAPGRVQTEQIGAGESARAVRALAASGGRVVAATDAGVFERAADDAVWRRVPGLPFGAATRIALAAEARGTVVWAVIEGALWRAADGEGASRKALPNGLEGEGGVIDVAGGAAGDVLVVMSRSLAVRSAAGEWRTARLVLPPGALPRRIAAEPGRLWLATDAGLLTAPRPEGPWRRAGAPVGHVAAHAIAGSGDRLVVATEQGLFRPAEVSAPAERGSPPVASRAAAREPTVLEVQQRALRYLALDPRRMQELWQAAGRRGWYPDVTVRGDYGRDRGDDRAWDQAFISGETHHLFDRDRNRDEGYAVSLQLSWSLGDAAFNLDRVDVSRETRLVHQLRDDVLDEINQLYFERQRVLASLQSPEPDAAPELLRLRAAELASGLDAWTGGWFSEQISGSASEGPGFPAQEPSP